MSQRGEREQGHLDSRPHGSGALGAAVGSKKAAEAAQLRGSRTQEVGKMSPDSGAGSRMNEQEQERTVASCQGSGALGAAIEKTQLLHLPSPQGAN